MTGLLDRMFPRRRILRAAELAGLGAALTGLGRSFAFQVRGGSMAPAIRDGDRVVVAPVEPHRLQAGEVVMTGGAQPLVHRLVHLDLRSRQLVTRGDALAATDPPLPFDQLIGRVVQVRRPLAGVTRALLTCAVRALSLRAWQRRLRGAPRA